MNKLSFKPLKVMLLGLLLVATSLSVNGQFTFQKHYDAPYLVNGSQFGTLDKKINAIASTTTSPQEYFFAGGAPSFGPQSSNGGNSGIISKLNKKGEVIWSRKRLTDGFFTDIKCTYDDNGSLTGTIIAGSLFTLKYTPGYWQSNSQYFELLKMDVNGTTLHHKLYATNANCEKVEQVKTNGLNDGFIAVGKNNNNGNQIMATRVDENLNIIWSIKIDISGTTIDEAYSVKQTTDGGFIITGRSDNALIVLKLNSSGISVWQRKYEYNNVTFIGNDIIEVQNSQSQSEYYVLGNTKGTNDDDLIIIHINDLGVPINDVLIQLTGTHEAAEGIIALPSGELVISATSRDFTSTNALPLLLKVQWGVAAVFEKKYTSSYENTTVAPTQDNGFILGGTDDYNSSEYKFHIIKTDANGVSDCFEQDINASYVPASVTNQLISFTPTVLATQDNSSSLSGLIIEEEIICTDFCKDVIKQTPSSPAHACFGSAITLNVSCPQGTTSTVWYNSTNMNTVISSTSSYLISSAIADATYIVRCINENGCVLKEETITFTVSPAPYSSMETIHACYGQHLSLTSPCGGNETSIWLNPINSGPTLNIDALSEDTYLVNCVDQYGCVTRTHGFEVIIDYVPVSQLHTATICEGASYDLNQAVIGSGSCTWSTSPFYTPVIGPVVSPTVSTMYYAECRDAQGCYSYHAVDLTVTPATTLSMGEDICEGDVLVLNNYFSSNCAWTDVSTGNVVPSTGITPSVGTHSYQAVCVDANGCISIFTLNVTVHQLNTIHQTVYVNCGELFDFAAYSENCNGITSWAVLVGNDYVMLPYGWAPINNTTLYGFGTLTDEGCCLLVLDIIINQVPPTLHELCFNGETFEIPFNCVVGSIKEWTFNGAPVPNGTVNSPGVYEVVCKDENGCVIRRAIYTVVFDPECDQVILCVDEAGELFGPCPPETVTVICEKNGFPYPMSGSTAMANGVGTYVIKCLDADGNVIASHHFLVHNCDENQADFLMSTSKTDIVNRDIKVYPNPSNTGKFFLNVNTKADDICSVRIFDGQGKEIIPFKNIAPQSEELIDLSGRPSGIYHVQLLINNTPYTKIIVVE